MVHYADFEISLHRRVSATYSVEMSFILPNDDCDYRAVAEAQFDFAALRAAAVDPLSFGQILSKGLFASPQAQVAFARAQTAAQQQNPPLGLRVRLLVGASAPELLSLNWETLTLPGSTSPLSTNENILFSRYLSSHDWRPVRLRPKSDLKALVVIAGPSDLEKVSLAPVDVEGEITRAKAGLGTIPTTVLPGKDCRATLNALVSCLREGEHDILYLVCHGALIGDEPWLLLEDENGQSQRVSGIDLVNRLQDLTDRPRLVVLLSCQSAARGKSNALTALGPRLAEAGIPAVLAMQGSISMETAARFMPVFFRELVRDGQIDRALAAARGEVRERLDFWMPVLFSRLKSGQIWYVPRFSSGSFDAWEALQNAIHEKRCTPVLGPGLLEPWLGRNGDLARRWSEKYRYPLGPDDRDQLPRIAQYINRRDGAVALQSEFNRALREEILKHFPALVPPDLAGAEFWTRSQVLKAVNAIAAQSWQAPPTQIVRQLAEMRLPIYVTTNPDDLLAQALEQRGAKPIVRLCPWWGPADEEELETKCLYDGEPTEDEPLVYHLFGHLGTPESLVITEDNYFDFLIGYTRHKNHVPPIVRDVLLRTNLLFLGFRTDDWGYRVLFRTLIAHKGAAQFRENRHVNAQVEPEEGRLLDTRRALRYLEEIFTKDNIAIYWGRSEDFMRDLAQNLRAG
jgi:hypothetical protein